MANSVPRSPTPDDFDLTAILKSGVPGGFWPSDGVVLTVARGKDGKIVSRKVYKSNSTHAYKQSIEGLEEKPLQGLKDLCLLSNFSPCGDCAEKLCEWSAQNEGVCVFIRFAHLHNIHVRVHKVAEDNALGLRKLVEKGVQLKPLSDYDWLQLLMIDRGFAAKDEWIAKRKQVDEKNQKDLEEILQSTSLDETLEKMRLYWTFIEHFKFRNETALCNWVKQWLWEGNCSTEWTVNLLIRNADDLGRPYGVWKSIIFRLVLKNKFSTSGNV